MDASSTLPTPPRVDLPDPDAVESEALEVLAGEAPVDALNAKIARIDAFVKQFEVRINEETLSLDAAAQVSYDPNMLTKAFCDQPAKMAWFGALCAKLQRVVSRMKQDVSKAKMDVDRVRATVDGEVRMGLVPVPGCSSGKPTVDAVQAAITLDKRVIKAEDEVNAKEEAVIDAQETLDHARAVVEALRHRREVIVADGYLQAAEMKSSQLSVK